MMKRLLRAARRDALGIARLYIHLFFRGGVGKAHGGTMGERAMTTLAIWGIGLVLLPWGLYHSAASIWVTQGPFHAVVMVLLIAFAIWATYRLYRVVKPESQGTGADHIRGAEVHDLSGDGEQK